MSAPVIQVDCASCGTVYHLALPKVLVDKPQKSMSFRCNNCSYKFQIEPKSILEQSGVAQTLILVESNGLHVHHNLESVADLIVKEQYGPEDLIRVFGHEWVMLGDEPTLSSIFEAEQPSKPDMGAEQESMKDTRPPTELDGLEKKVFGSDHDYLQEDAIESVDVEVEDSLDHANTASDSSLRPPVSSGEQESVDVSEFSEIDPFSEGMQTAFDDLSLPNPTTASDDEDSFDDWLIEELELTEDEESELAEPMVEVDSNATQSQVEVEIMPEDDSDDWLSDLTIAESLDVDGPETEFPVSETDTPDEVNVEVDELHEFDEESLAANLWEELQIDEEFEDETPDQMDAPVSSPEVEEASVSETTISPEEKTIQSLKSELLGPVSDKTQLSTPMQATATMEFEEGDADDESQSVEPVSKPKQKLSFSNRVPEVEKIEKREVNQLYVFAGIIFFSIGVLGYVLWNSEPEPQDFAGMELNSNKLREMENAKDGLQQNDNEDGTAPEDSESIQEGAKQASLEGSSQGAPEQNQSGSNEGADNIATTSIGQMDNPYPQVLPDVPEESLDFANDKSASTLTREGYQALRKGQPDLAKRLFSLALEKEPTYAHAVLGLGKTYQERGEFSAAIQSYCQHAELPASSFSKATMGVEVGMSQSLVSQLGGSCDES